MVAAGSNFWNWSHKSRIGAADCEVAFKLQPKAMSLPLLSM